MVVILEYGLTILVAVVVGEGWCFWGRGERRVVVALVVVLGPFRIHISLHMTTFLCLSFERISSIILHRMK